ncbi:hypothetical protein D9611_011807 [Ephemerocybe angulata]|uniref:Uncharacterized protein n=1 Tax=Ephemerocybe angulata TaxID=980116 RepID=A0A8H5BY74_9AGAR|nr:hypothetical protein D9611_011807 [Tulosesus angulatus]
MEEKTSSNTENKSTPDIRLLEGRRKRPCDDIMFLLRYTTYKGEEQYRNPEHPDAFKFRIEKDSDVRCRDAFIRFFKSQGVASVTANDFTYGFVAGKHPKDRVPY